MTGVGGPEELEEREEVDPAPGAGLTRLGAGIFASFFIFLSRAISSSFFFYMND